MSVEPKKRPNGTTRLMADIRNTWGQKLARYISASTIKQQKWAYLATGRAWNSYVKDFVPKEPRLPSYRVSILGRWLEDMHTSLNGRNGARLWLLLLWRYQRKKRRQPPTCGYLINARRLLRGD